MLKTIIGKVREKEQLNDAFLNVRGEGSIPKVGETNIKHQKNESRIKFISKWSWNGLSTELVVNFSVIAFRFFAKKSVKGSIYVRFYEIEYIKTKLDEMSEKVDKT